MGHVTSKGYLDLRKRLDKAPQGATESKTIFKILEILFTKKEAEYVSILPMSFFTLEEACELFKKNKSETRKILNGLADKGILLDMKKGNTHAYLLAPTIVGFFELALMRTSGEINHQILSELFYEYINKEEAYIHSLFNISPPIARIFPQENSIEPETVILDYERASRVIKNSKEIALGICYCRHKKEHLGKACDNPQEVCMSFNFAAQSLINHKIAKKITKKKALEILDQCVKLGLVQIGDNVKEDVWWMCNCCSCCCDTINAYKRFGGGIDSGSNFYSKNDIKKCVGCGVCARKCTVSAIKLVKKNNKKYAVVDKKLCVGCGVCANFCASKSLILKRKKKNAFIPKDIFERYVLSAVDQGKLQNLIFDNYKLMSHKILRSLLGVLINNPLKLALASRQLESRFLSMLTKTKHYELFDKLYHEAGEKADYSHKELDVVDKKK